MDEKVVVVFLCSLLAFVAGQRRPVGLGVRSPPGCGVCALENCKPPVDCEAGIVKDSCNCCDMCGKKEFERCDHPSAPAPDQGRCGENLECKLRDDLDADDEPQAVCFCAVEGTLCGTDGMTYDNICQLTSTAVKMGSKITVQNKGPCKAAPVIVSGPENAKDRIGKNVALVCEATGYPIPTIEWTWTRVDGKTVYLPSDDLHVSVNMRGGPEKWQITGWLQVMDMQKTHEGDYTCIAQNDMGMDKSMGRIIVIEDTYDTFRNYDRPFGGYESKPRRRNNNKYRSYSDEY